ncbi:MAG: hypothetical protein ACKO1T_11680 [Sediminibacterium sp.]
MKKNFSLLAVSLLPRFLFFSTQGKERTRRLVILYSYGLYSQKMSLGDPITAKQKLAILTARIRLVDRIRAEGHPVLLIDGGDMIGSARRENILAEDPELFALSVMKYDAAIPGEKEWDAGWQQWKEVGEYLQIPWLACNYVVKETPLQNCVKSFVVKDLGGIRVGLIGIAAECKQGIQQEDLGGVQFLPPLQAMNQTAALLKQKGCELIVCFNHGISTGGDENYKDSLLAKENEYVDLMVGCHPQLFYRAPRIYTNKLGKNTIVFQLLGQEIFFGRIDLNLPEKGGDKPLTFNQLIALKKIAE